jgi:hypothetical protein
MSEVNSRRNSLQSLDGLAEQLDHLNDSSPAAMEALTPNVYVYKDTSSPEPDLFDLNRDRALSKMSITDDNMYAD